MIRRAVVLVGDADDGVFQQAAAALRATLPPDVPVELPAASQARRGGELGSRLNLALQDLDASTVLILAPEVELDAGCAERLFVTAEEGQVIACPLLLDWRDRIRSAGRTVVAGFGREWVAEFLQGETAGELELPPAIEIPFPPPAAFAVARETALAAGGFATAEDGTLDVDEFAERVRGRGGSVRLVSAAAAELVHDWEPTPLERVRDPHALGHPARRTAVAAELAEATALLPLVKEAPPAGHARTAAAPYVFGRVGAMGSSAEELRGLVAGLHAAGLAPAADLEALPLGVRLGPELREIIAEAARRPPSQTGEIWTTAADCWLAAAGEPGLIRLPNAGCVGRGLRRALEDPGALAVVPSERVLHALVSAGLPREKVRVLPPFLSLPSPGPSAGTGAVHAFLDAADARAMRAALRALRNGQPEPRVTLTWPLGRYRREVAEILPGAHVDTAGIWSAGGPSAAAVVLLVDGWDRYARRLRAALAQGAAVVAEQRYAEVLNDDEASRCRFVDRHDEHTMAAAIQAASAAGVRAPDAPPAWEEQVQTLTIEARERARDRRAGGVLIVTPWLPSDRESAGHLRLLEIVEGFRDLGTDVTLAAAHEGVTDRVDRSLQGGALALSSRGARIELRGRLARRGHDVVYAHFHELASWIRPALFAEAEATPLVVDSVDLHFVRHLQQAAVQQDERARQKALDLASPELVSYALADAVVLATDADEQRLQEVLGPRRTKVVTTIHRARQAVPPAASRAGILFVGGFAHPPNRDAVEWLMREIAPRLEDQGCTQPIIVVGSKMPRDLAALVAQRGGTALGFLPRLAPVMDRVRCSIAPLRFGAGMKGKIGESLAAGVPVVSTTVGAEGFPANAGLMVCDDPDEMTAQLLRLLADDVLWQDASRAALAAVTEHLGPERCRDALRDLLSSVA